jgi:glycosyltransferase involved in cell wall biosynthesis
MKAKSGETEKLPERGLVSVIVPVFNGERYLAEAIESVLEQDYPDLELIVIDDGSTDGTVPIARGYGDRLHLISQPNSGVSAARNRGLSTARGEYIAFLDADDVMLPGKLAGQAAGLEAQPELGSIHSGWHLIDARGKRLATMEPWKDAPTIDLEAWLTWCPFYLPAMLFRREWLERIGGFNQALPQAEDADLLLRMCLEGCRTAWQKQPTVSYRQHEHSTMRNGTQQAESITGVMTKFFAREDLPADLRQKQNEFLFNTHMWSVWHLYKTGHLDGIAEYLGRSRAYRAQPPMQTARLWLERMARTSVDQRMPLEPLRALWPHFRAAADIGEADRVQFELTLDRWLKFLIVLYGKSNGQTPR